MSRIEYFLIDSCFSLKWRSGIFLSLSLEYLARLYLAKGLLQTKGSGQKREEKRKILEPFSATIYKSLASYNQGEYYENFKKCV